MSSDVLNISMDMSACNLFLGCDVIASIIQPVNDDETTDTKVNKRPARFLLQMPDDLRFTLHRESVANGRSLTSEINMRLKASLHATGIAPAAVAGLLPKAYAALAGKIPDPGEADALATGDQSEREKDLLSAFRALPTAKQKALIALLK